MSNPGEIGWFDLTVPDAKAVRDFYRAVVGWDSQDHDMGEYSDYEMVVPSTGQRVAGVCHARGPNAEIPPQWMLYITVADMEASIAACESGGGEVVVPPREVGSYGKIGIIRDPAGAVCALWEQREGESS
ncbi:MAG: VOC family protein [Planctomycetota bacterium]|jgi:predicted enzyme related to lactoylglutathione lyase